MKELDINIEGYNVNGICVACLNYNRKMYYDTEVPEMYKILADIEMAVGISIKICWECLAAVRAVCRFRDQILKSYDFLSYYSRNHPYLDSPEDFTPHAVQRLQRSSVKAEDVVVKFCEDAEVKSECDYNEYDDLVDWSESKVEDVNIAESDKKVKDEFNIDPILETVPEAEVTSDEDIQLSKLKKKKEKREKKCKSKKETKKTKKKKCKKKSKESNEDSVECSAQKKQSRKLKNLPKDLVELYTMREQEMWLVRHADRASDEFQKMKYKCEDCVLGFHTQRLMIYHSESKHRKKTEACVQCDVCKCYLVTKENLSTHRGHHRNALRCLACNHRTTLKQDMLQHVRVHLPPGYQCSQCNEEFSSKSKLLYHKNNCHQERPQCDCCGKVFANKMTLKYHLKILPQNKEDKPKPKLQYIPCKGCDKVFPSQKSYRAHVVIHEGVTYPCPICGKLFQWKRNLSRHTRNHRERDAGALHECRECGKTFSSRDCYNNHMKLSKRHVAQDALSHECSYCGKKFATKWCMVDHIDWDHLKRIKYQCSVCFKAFKTAKIMVAHYNNIHEGKKNKEPDGEHLCEICGKSYKTVKRLKGHVWAMHTNRSTCRRFKCKLCPATFTWQTSIYKHTKMMHSSGKRPPQRQMAAKKQETYQDLVATNRIPYFPLTDIQTPQLLHAGAQYPTAHFLENQEKVEKNQ